MVLHKINHILTERLVNVELGAGLISRPCIVATEVVLVPMDPRTCSSLTCRGTTSVVNFKAKIHLDTPLVTSERTWTAAEDANGVVAISNSPCNSLTLSSASSNIFFELICPRYSFTPLTYSLFSEPRTH